MSNTTIALRQSGATGNLPSLGVLANGELAINYADGILYYKTTANTLGSIQTATPGGLNQEIQFNDSGSFGGDSSLTYNKTTNTLTVDNATVGGLNVAPMLQSSFDVANTAQADATGAFSKANSANVLAQAAFDKANTDVTSVSVTPGTYGNTSAIPSITVDANGRVSNITTQSFEAATIGDVLAISIALG
jgi:hypothetical protein